MKNSRTTANLYPFVMNFCLAWVAKLPGTGIANIWSMDIHINSSLIAVCVWNFLSVFM